MPRSNKYIMFTREMNAASTTPIILSILQKQESYGYAIVDTVKELSGNKISWPEGVLYPVLHRLESKKLIKSTWRIGDSGRKRKYYSITSEGLKALEREKKQWTIATGVLDSLWGTIPQLSGVTK